MFGDQADNTPAEAAATSAGSRLLCGVGGSGLNPKGLLIFLAMLPQFADSHSAWPVRLQLAALGSGPALVLVVGAFSDRSSTKTLAARLGSRFTVYEYDRRGRGDSGDTAPWVIEREVEDVAAVTA